MHPPWFHNLIGRAAISVALWVVAKVLIRINTRASAFPFVGLTQELEMGSDPGFLTADQVTNVAIASISDHEA